MKRNITLFDFLKNDEIIMGLIIVLFSIFVYSQSIKMPDFGRSFESPGLLPVFIAVVMFLLGIIIIIEEIKKTLNQFSKKGEISEQEDPNNNEPLLNKRIIIAIIIIIAYVMILPVTGFLIASILFLFLMMNFLKAGNVFFIGILSVLTSIIIKYVFANIFQQLIP